MCIKESIKNKAAKTPLPPRKAKIVFETSFSSFKRLAKRKKVKVYKIKLKKVSGSKFIPQKLWAFELERKVEIPNIKRSKKIDKVNLLQIKLNFPELKTLIAQRIIMKKQKTAKSSCLFAATGKFVKGRNQIGNRNTNR